MIISLYTFTNRVLQLVEYVLYFSLIVKKYDPGGKQGNYIKINTNTPRLRVVWAGFRKAKPSLKRVCECGGGERLRLNDLLSIRHYHLYIYVSGQGRPYCLGRLSS